MSTTTFGKPKCTDCGYEFDESPDLPIEQRPPCPKCGSTKRNQSVTISEDIQIHDTLRVKGRHQGKGRPFMEMISGAEFSHRFKKWMNKLRLIDHDNDVYQERVEDPDTGEVIHETKEKLSEHVGHGSAKKKSS